MYYELRKVGTSRARALLDPTLTTRLLKTDSRHIFFSFFRFGRAAKPRFADAGLDRSGGARHGCDVRGGGAPMSLIFRLKSKPDGVKHGLALSERLWRRVGPCAAVVLAIGVCALSSLPSQAANWFE